MKIKKKLKPIKSKLRQGSGEYMYDPTETDEMSIRHEVRARELYHIKTGVGNLLQRIDDVKRDGTIRELAAVDKLLQSFDFILIAGEAWRTQHGTPSSPTKKRR